MMRLLVIGALVMLHCAVLLAQQTRPAAKGTDYEALLPADARQLKIGDAAPEFSLKGIDDRTYTLADFADAPVLMVAFLSNHCPYSHAAETRLIPFVTEMKARGLATVAINPNSPDAVGVHELGYSKYNDSFEEMKLYARDARFTFPYLYDGDTQKAAKAYGALCTPHVFVFDRERKLRYAGRFDDSRYADGSTVKSHDAKIAVESLLAGKPVPVELTKPMGCSTKWLEHKRKLAAVEKKWTDAPVTLDTIDADGVKKLAKNGTSKVRLINVWATWCGPCVAEFPHLVSLSRRMQNRDFELITISVDDSKDEAKVKKFLEEQHAATPARITKTVEAEGRKSNNYLFTGADAGALMQALDPKAPGPVPYTIIVAPDGEVIYRSAGMIDVGVVQGKLIDALGAYYTPPGSTAPDKK
jgi:peroxiredoxin